jgi:hypothetical protein
MNERYALASQLAAEQVVAAIADRQGITPDEALAEFSKSGVYDRLLDPDTGLWHENPLDIADLCDMEAHGSPASPDTYYP